MMVQWRLRPCPLHLSSHAITVEKKPVRVLAGGQTRRWRGFQSNLNLSWGSVNHLPFAGIEAGGERGRKKIIIMRQIGLLLLTKFFKRSRNSCCVTFRRKSATAAAAPRSRVCRAWTGGHWTWDFVRQVPITFQGLFLVILRPACVYAYTPERRSTWRSGAYAASVCALTGCQMRKITCWHAKKI